MKYTQEQLDIINDLEYLHVCTKCKIPKPNKEYTICRHKNRARKYLSSCKECKNEFYKNGPGKSSKLKTAISQRKKHRLNMMFNSAKGNAKRKGIFFDLVEQDIIDLYESQNGLCFYTGKPMYKDITGFDNSNDSVSIDKIIPKNGYTKSNIVLCRWIVNRIKQDLTIDDFLNMVNDIKINLKWEPPTEI